MEPRKYKKIKINTEKCQKCSDRANCNGNPLLHDVKQVKASLDQFYNVTQQPTTLVTLAEAFMIYLNTSRNFAKTIGLVIEIMHTEEKEKHRSAKYEL